jgi:hypothetical protein
MRLWTLHPKYLDGRGLVALWREGLLAQAVLRGETQGYRFHPQLVRFRAEPAPLAAIAQYLQAVQGEAAQRGYQFNTAKVGPERTSTQIAATAEQLWYEFAHLQGKLRRRDPQRYRQLLHIEQPEAHPLFHIVAGDVQAWERGAGEAGSQQPGAP